MVKIMMLISEHMLSGSWCLLGHRKLQRAQRKGMYKSSIIIMPMMVKKKLHDDKQTGALVGFVHILVAFDGRKFS